MKDKMKILLVGSADLSDKTIGGQLEKTKLVYRELIDRDIKLSFCNIFELGIGLRLLTRFIYSYFSNTYIILITSGRGTDFFIKLIFLLKKIKKKVVVVLVVGNQDEYLSQLCDKKLKVVDKYYFEVEEMADNFKTRVNSGFLSNCKNICKQENNNKIYYEKKICYYSEISYRKGFDTIVSVLDEINSKTIKCYMDVYGFYSESKEEKEKMQALCKNRSYISYKGLMDRAYAAEKLGQYMFMVFPTRHSLEGVPGAIVDAYEAGLPVISSDVAYLSHVVKNGITGYIFHDRKELVNLINEILQKEDKVLQLRNNCLKEADKYNIGPAIDMLLNELKQMNKK